MAPLRTSVASFDAIQKTSVRSRNSLNGWGADDTNDSRPQTARPSRYVWTSVHLSLDKEGHCSSPPSTAQVTCPTHQSTRPHGPLSMPGGPARPPFSAAPTHPPRRCFYLAPPGSRFFLFRSIAKPRKASQRAPRSRGQSKQQGKTEIERGWRCSTW